MSYRVLANPKFLPTDSDLFSSQIRRTDRPRQNKVIIYVYMYIYIYIIHVYAKNVDEMIAQTGILCNQGFFFFEKKKILL